VNFCKLMPVPNARATRRFGSSVGRRRRVAGISIARDCCCGQDVTVFERRPDGRRWRRVTIWVIGANGF